MACYSGCSGCTGGCTGCGPCTGCLGCTGCSGTCKGSCTSCSGCSGCTSCSGTCSGGCSGCSSCTGCSGCGKACQNDCSGCSGSCSGCSGCSSCYGTCSGICDNACTSTSAATTISNLGSAVATGGKFVAGALSPVLGATVGEYTRRSLSTTGKVTAFSTADSAGNFKLASQIQGIFTNLNTFPNSGKSYSVSSGQIVKASDLTDAITYTRTLMNTNLRL